MEALQNDIILLWLIGGVILAILSIYLTVRPYFPAAVTAYGAMWLMTWSHAIHPAPWLLTSWGIAVAIVVATDLLHPHSLSRATNGMGYIGSGALVGVMVGMTAFSFLWMVVGAAVGTLAGGYFYARTPAGKPLQFPSPRFFQYLCAKGLPAIVTASVLGITLLLWIMESHPVAAISYI